MPLGRLKGLDLQLLVVHKKNAASHTSEMKYIINKVDMYNYNFVINHHF